MSKRTGTAKWDERRKHWRIVVQKDGERRECTSSTPGRAGQREANKKADDWLDGITPSKRLKVSEAYEKYKSDQLGRRSTVNDKEIVSRGRAWIIPYIGKKYLDSVTLGDLQSILNDAERKGKSRKTIRNIRGRLSSFFKFCRLNGWTQLRTDDLLVSDHAPVMEKHILQEDDLRKLFSCETTFLRGCEVRDDYVNAYRLQVLCGLRPGELLGLQWDDISDGVMHIRRAINSFGEETCGKNDNAIRNIVVGDLMQKTLDNQRNLTGDSMFVFSNISTEQTYRKHWYQYCDYNGINRVTVYELRHTFVSITASVLSEGSMKSLVGHSRSMDTYGVYGHLVDGDLGKSAKIIDARFNEILDASD